MRDYVRIDRALFSQTAWHKQRQLLQRLLSDSVVFNVYVQLGKKQMQMCTKGTGYGALVRVYFQKQQIVFEQFVQRPRNKHVHFGGRSHGGSLGVAGAEDWPVRVG